MVWSIGIFNALRRSVRQKSTTTALTQQGESMLNAYHRIPNSRFTRKWNVAATSAKRTIIRSSCQTLEWFVLSPGKWQAWLLSWVCLALTAIFALLVINEVNTRQLNVLPIDIPRTLQVLGYK